MNYQQQCLNNINDKIQDTHIPKHTIKYINLLSSSEDEHTDEDIEILNNSKQSIHTPQFKDKQYHKTTTNTSIFNDHNTFTQKSDLQSHLKVHNDKKSHKYQQCDFKCKWKSNLTIHQRIHNGEKPYKCLHCPKSFITKHQLTQHLTVHTNEKPYKCNDCDYKTKWKGNLKQHSLKKHKSTTQQN